MKKIIALTLALISIFALMLMPTAAAADKTYTIKLGHTMSTSHPRHLALLEFEKYVEEQTGGKVQIELYPAAVLGSEPDMQESMRMGTLEAFVGAVISVIIIKSGTPIVDFAYVLADEIRDDGRMRLDDIIEHHHTDHDG